MATSYTLSTYSLATVATTVPALSATPNYIWTVSVPSALKGKAAILQFFFNLYSSTGFYANQAFNYGIYVDGTSVSIGESTSIAYTQSSSNTYALSVNGVLRGTNGFHGYSPLIIPISFSTTANQIQLGITNSSLAMSAVSSASPHVTSNVTTATGTINTTNYIPINTFTTVGSNTYTVPTTVQGGAVQGVFLYCWGAGGQAYSTSATTGGGGGFSSGYYACSGGTVLTYVVGGSATGTASNGYGGGAGANGNGGGGGFSGIFSTITISQGSAIIMAGGGGGCTTTANGAIAGNGGGGGGSSASYGLSVIGGQITSGYWGFYNFSFTQASQTGGYAALSGQGASGFYGGGGGGYYGGSQTNGGSGYTGGLTSGASMTNGTTLGGINSTPATILPGGSNNSLYVSGYGCGNGAGGMIVIIPAVSASAVQIGISATAFTV